MTKILAIDGGFKKDSQVGISVLYYGGGYTVNLEAESTVQRAEVNGLLLALNHLKGEEATIITDSQYVAHTIQKEWYINWYNKNWVTAAEEPVKNKDLWLQVYNLMQDANISIVHVSSHVLSIGKVAVDTLLREKRFDIVEDILYQKYDKPISAVVTTRISKAVEAFKIINGIECPEDSFRKMVVYNTLVDSVVEHIKGGL